MVEIETSGCSWEMDDLFVIYQLINDYKQNLPSFFETRKGKKYTNGRNFDEYFKGYRDKLVILGERLLNLRAIINDRHSKLVDFLKNETGNESLIKAIRVEIGNLLSIFDWRTTYAREISQTIEKGKLSTGDIPTGIDFPEIDTESIHLLWHMTEEYSRIFGFTGLGHIVQDLVSELTDYSLDENMTSQQEQKFWEKMCEYLSPQNIEKIHGLLLDFEIVKNIEDFDVLRLVSFANHNVANLLTAIAMEDAKMLQIALNNIDHISEYAVWLRRELV